MSKVICDVCGTMYQDTAPQCPICGSPREMDAQASAGEAGIPGGEGAYTYVKGGRFSKSNVRKRSHAVQSKPEPRKPEGSGSKEKKNGSNRGLVIAIVILLVAIIAVCVYIYVRFFAPMGGIPLPSGTEPSTSASEPGNQEATLPCNRLTVEDGDIFLDGENQVWALRVTPEPVNTTDVITYTSSNDSVATVDSQGNVKAVGEGRATITIACGAASVTCDVECTWTQEPTTEPAPTTEPVTEPSTEPETKPQGDFQLNRSDITMAKRGETWQLYNGPIKNSEIKWSTGNANIATVENGKVTAVGRGTTTIYAEYRGTKVSCIIRCSFAAVPDASQPDETTEPGETTPPEETTKPVETTEATKPVEGTEP